MKIIITHDVDHLFSSDHLTDLIYPKLWVRETLKYHKRQITFEEWQLRMFSPFKKERHNIFKLLSYEKKRNIPSTFFFGMNRGLGLSYKAKKAIPIIKLLLESDVTVGVHGIAYKNLDKINKEYETFKQLIGIYPLGIRTHYVRYNENTFQNFSKVGYLFDSSEFDKNKRYCIKAPYKVGDMWEFPLTIMDGYLPYNFNDAKKQTIKILEEAQKCHIEYITILLHDYLFTDAYQQTVLWYKWLLEYFEKQEYEFISFQDAIKKLEARDYSSYDR